jgi:DNA polymerase-3 subunit beta
VLTGTNTEVELVCTVPTAQVEQAGKITVPARKLADICRSMPDQASLQFNLEGEKLYLSFGQSRFTLSTLSAEKFPNIEDVREEIVVKLVQKDLKAMLDSTSFAMAHQDVRYYLNGMLLEISGQHIRTVATDGHRLALANLVTKEPVGVDKQIIIPRKGVLELGHLLSDTDQEVLIAIGENHIFSQIGRYKFTSKLIDGKFPDYNRVIPKGGDKILVADREQLKDMFQRASILSHENIRGVQLHLSRGELRVYANNPEHEQAEDALEVHYDNEPLQIGFNVNYLIDVMNNIKDDQVKITLSNQNSSALIESTRGGENLYVVMPMRL